MVDSVKAALERWTAMAVACCFESTLVLIPSQVLRRAFQSFSNQVYKVLRNPRYPVTLPKTFFHQKVNGEVAVQTAFMCTERTLFTEYVHAPGSSSFFTTIPHPRLLLSLSLIPTMFREDVHRPGSVRGVLLIPHSRCFFTTIPHQELPNTAFFPNTASCA